MKVMMISKALVVGAYQRKAEELARLPGLDLLVVAPPSWKQEGKHIRLRREFTDGYQLEIEPIALNGHFHVHWYPFLRRRFAAFRPDVVHIDEEAYNLSTFQALRLAKRYSARTLFFTWQNIDRRYPFPFSAFEAYAREHADACVAGNQEAAQIQRSRGFQREIEVIPQFGVDPDLFRPKGTPRERLGFTIGFSGRLVKQKGLLVLCEAFERLPEDCRLLLAGDGPLEGEIRQRAQARGWAARLDVVSLPASQMPTVYQRMDCLVLPSLTTPAWKEQFGRAAIEAMACEIPVVGSDSGEIPRVLGTAGIVTPEGDVEALRQTLARLRDSPEECRRLAAAGRARVMAEYTQAALAQRLFAVYKRIAGALH